MTPIIRTFDIETSPITAYSWGLHDQNIGLQQMVKDWSILAWAGKEIGKPQIQYYDNRRCLDPQDDKSTVTALWKFLNETDIVITQNGDKFDIKKFNARAAIHGLPPVRPYKSIDLLKESRKVFSFTSHSLDYMSRTLNTKYKKLKHKRYPGFELWTAVLSRDKQAWEEMETYCIQDVMATEELYETIKGWIKIPNLAVYGETDNVKCRCGSTKLELRGFTHSDTAKYQRYRCKDCHKWTRGNLNLLSTEFKKNQLKEKT